MNLGGSTGSFPGSSRLVSERIAETAASCRATFGIYRYLDTQGTLSLYLEDDAQFKTKLWTAPQAPGTRVWTPISVSIGRRRIGFRAVFVSTHAGTTSTSDLSIDDFKFVECDVHEIGHCEGFTDPFNCSNGNCIHQDNVK